MQAGLSVQMRPLTAPQQERFHYSDESRSSIPYSLFQNLSRTNKLLLSPQTKQTFQKARQVVEEAARTTGDNHYDVVIHTLGTASAQPSKYRNGMGIPIELPLPFLTQH
jgi:hypothetical protein